MQDDLIRKEIEQLHEDSNLTGNLGDDSARLLLAWAEGLIRGGPLQGGMKVAAPPSSARVRELTRAVNRLAGNLEQTGETELVRELINLLNTALSAEPSTKA